MIQVEISIKPVMVLIRNNKFENHFLNPEVKGALRNMIPEVMKINLPPSPQF